MMNLDSSNRLESANGRILAKQKNWGTLHMGSQATWTDLSYTYKERD